MSWQNLVRYMLKFKSCKHMFAKSVSFPVYLKSSYIFKKYTLLIIVCRLTKQSHSATFHTNLSVAIEVGALTLLNPDLLFFCPVLVIIRSQDRWHYNWPIHSSPSLRWKVFKTRTNIQHNIDCHSFLSSWCYHAFKSAWNHYLF